MCVDCGVSFNLLHWLLNFSFMVYTVALKTTVRFDRSRRRQTADFHALASVATTIIVRAILRLLVNAESSEVEKTAAGRLLNGKNLIPVV